MKTERPRAPGSLSPPSSRLQARTFSAVRRTPAAARRRLSCSARLPVSAVGQSHQMAAVLCTVCLPTG